MRLPPGITVSIGTTLLFGAPGFAMAEGMPLSREGKPQVAAHVEGNLWQVEIAIPWRSLPGLSGAPGQLRAQCARWRHDSQYDYDCWSPTLTFWAHPDTRFGWLVFRKE